MKSNVFMDNLGMPRHIEKEVNNECELKESNKLCEPPMDFVTFKNLVSEKAGALEGFVVRIADGLIGTVDEEITQMIAERVKLIDMFNDEGNKTSHTFMNFLNFIYASLELTGRMVSYIKTMVLNPGKINDSEPCPTEPSDPIFSPMNNVINNVCVKCGSIKSDLFMISEEFRPHECIKDDELRFDINHTIGVLDYINNDLFIMLDICDDIITTIFGEQLSDVNPKCCASKG